MSYTSADKSALRAFLRKPVSSDMVEYLVLTTNSVIRVKPQTDHASAYPSPPSTPLDPRSKLKRATPLTVFIQNLIKYSNVQTPTLMSTLVYLTRLRAILPPTSYGIETTRHRVFLGCLILAAKNLNDSSPLNKHWTQYTDGLLSLKEVNTIERELLSYLNWDLGITNTDLINCFSPFLQPIKDKIKSEANRNLIELTQKQYQYQEVSNLKPLKTSTSYSSIGSSTSSNAIPGLMASSSSNTIASSTSSSLPTPSNSLHHLDKIAETINHKSGADYELDNSDFRPRPLRLRSSMDNLNNIPTQYHPSSKKFSSRKGGQENQVKIADRSSKGFSFLSGVGRITS